MLVNQKTMPEKLLILGGTREAYQLAENLDAKLPHENINFISSLAGTTKNQIFLKENFVQEVSAA